MQAMKQCVFNYMIVSHFFMFAFLNFYDFQMPWRYEKELPSYMEQFRQIIICLMCEDFFFHFSHRLLHTKNKNFPIYQWVHKQHHEHLNPIAITAEDIHWFEYLVSNLCGTMFGPCLFGSKMHYWTLSAWGVVRIAQSLDAHCGYEFPWSIFGLIPFGCPATYHHWHHTKNVGNYSSYMTIWDTIFDSNADYYLQYPNGI